MRWTTRIAAAALCAALQACVTPPAIGPAPVTGVAEESGKQRAPVTILVSIDGFRPDYLTRGVTPNLSALAASGVSAAIRPSFPSITFPNHWTLVTGLRPDRNGVVGNKMEDARRPGETFTMQSDDPFWWNEAEPLWVTAEKAGIRTATMFWPGANVAIGGTALPNRHGAIDGGTRPSDWMQFNQAVTGEQRVATVLDWLRRPAATRPRFVTLYFDTVDSAGHQAGPDGAATTAAVGDVDRLIGQLTQGLAELGQPANLVIVADHGMAATSSARVVALDRIEPAADFRVIESGPYATLFPAPGREKALEARLLQPQPHLTCWRKEDVPQRLHYGRNPRVPPYVCLAEAGWLIQPTKPTRESSGGSHGYDPADPAMAALFIASGPAIRAGGTLPAFDNVDVAPLVRDLIGLPSGKGLDGDDAPFRGVLATK